METLYKILELKIFDYKSGIRKFRAKDIEIGLIRNETTKIALRPKVIDQVWKIEGTRISEISARSNENGARIIRILGWNNLGLGSTIEYFRFVVES